MARHPFPSPRARSRAAHSGGSNPQSVCVGPQHHCSTAVRLLLTESIRVWVSSVTASSCVNRTNWGGLPPLPSGEVSEASMAAARAAAGDCADGQHTTRLQKLPMKAEAAPDGRQTWKGASLQLPPAKGKDGGRQGQG